ncbi:FAD/FMN-containing dehydrogenase [Panacagrimonas perspica]|uniref:FAD/FMN-containing dehydrogenase n=1 Tax=Panacagrimonas perspica TaxID=381431 RepID=A0A4R7P4L6_9GAMM|nr:FAD-binding oxidoreductase [Panacagrimonas perspica]TDU28705.1 FAD/FMN-containing dehydrogenase [Panacagrimonas perspica]THD05029.1 FAD-binding oxidoreductase [Panacagrimonas perspica]
MPGAGSSWGRWPRHRHRTIALTNRYQRLVLDEPGTLLPYGNGRSYGDSCQNDGGFLLTTRGLDRYVAFDVDNGVIECEAGMLLEDVIEFALPRGWFLPVTPGTCFVTLGGAIANDVHGKNHHRLGTFGHHVLGFELLRSDGSERWCTPSENADWFAATIGGLGLTGLIRRLRLQLRRVPGPFLRGQSLRFGNLSGFFELSRDSDADYEYTVSWLDCTAKGRQRGRGVFMRANHAVAEGTTPGSGQWRVPFTSPLPLVNRLSLRLFNTLYYHRPAARRADAVWHYRPFFYPLDGVLEWNRIYGPRGFYQYQCVIPPATAPESLEEMLETIAVSGSGSFLGVLKMFGEQASPGLLSFARSGTTLALDFPNGGAPTLQLLESLDAITRKAGGAVYPAKDARMSATSFQQYFPRWKEFLRFIDPRFSSSFWRRVSQDPQGEAS